MIDRLSIRISGMLLLGATALGLITAPSFAGDFANQPLFKLVGANHANDASVAPAQSNPYGMSYVEWSAAWWQWAFSLPLDHSPLFGTADCSAGQSGHVWFLPGAVVGGATPREDCTVPTGTSLFVAVINAECSNLEGSGNTEGQLRSCADSISGLIDKNSLRASLDGEPLTDLSRYLVESPLFRFGPLPDNNLIRYFCVAQGEGCPAAPRGSFGYAVGTGVYLMFQPLSAGRHTLTFHGEAADAALVVDTTYHLTVRP
jgi:hypothetical protein